MEVDVRYFLVTQLLIRSYRCFRVVIARFLAVYDMGISDIVVHVLFMLSRVVICG